MTEMLCLVMYLCKAVLNSYESESNSLYRTSLVTLIRLVSARRFNSKATPGYITNSYQLATAAI